ncbi:hypothetical protein FSARC_861 [Fusarium sarcochroum]|uniref:Glycosyl transferase 64 domain-containing protein n=1 Tax=Fusarium sarcochroum TaxID=1208366 RepID=A0A8H4XEW8_9HYPO|nr:hypothetical protein FSARC_861 [Fusarium sarcochroum]
MAIAGSNDEMKPMPFADPLKASYIPTYNLQKPNKKWMILILSVVSFIACMVFASLYGVDYDAMNDEVIPEVTNFTEISSLSTYEESDKECGKRDEVANMTLWNELVEKTSHLIEDKFTIVLQTYKRPTQLEKTLAHLTAAEIPSLGEIVVVWNDDEIEPPKDYISGDTNVSVRFRRSKENSLNQKFLPDPDYMTQGVFLSDDDWNYNITDLEFVFQQWRRAGMHRLTGAFARCWRTDEKGDPVYDYCRGGADQYQLVLTGLAFSHMSYLEYYWSDDRLMTAIRDYIDDQMNCEDIALNFLASMLTCEGPLQVVGLQVVA